MGRKGLAGHASGWPAGSIMQLLMPGLLPSVYCASHAGVDAIHCPVTRGTLCSSEDGLPDPRPPRTAPGTRAKITPENKTSALLYLYIYP